MYCVSLLNWMLVCNAKGNCVDIVQSYRLTVLLQGHKDLVLSLITSYGCHSLLGLQVQLILKLLHMLQTKNNISKELGKCGNYVLCSVLHFYFKWHMTLTISSCPDLSSIPQDLPSLRCRGDTTPSPFQFFLPLSSGLQLPPSVFLTPPKEKRLSLEFTEQKQLVCQWAKVRVTPWRPHP